MNKIFDKIEPGQTKDVNISVPLHNAEKGYIVLQYDDEYGNEYETRVLVDFKRMKVLEQKFRKVKIVKDVGDKIPMLEIDENSLKMAMSANASNTEIVKEK